jgi:simple sugar transport system substrate-binding protein
MKIQIYLCIICLLVLGLSGCANYEPEPEIQKRLVFGFSQLGAESEWRTSSTNDIRRAAIRAGVQLVFDNALQNQANQIKALRSFILSGVDVIAFSPIIETGWDNVLGEARAAGIPVILVDRHIETNIGGLYTAFIGSDFHSQGIKAGKWLIDRFAGIDGPIKIAEISGTANSTPTIGRADGLREALWGNPKFEIVISVSGDFMRSKGRESMEAIIRRTPDIDVLFAHNDDMALGAIEILEEHGIIPGTDIVIISVDAQRSGLEALKEGKINCLIECNPYIGDELMDLAFRIVNGEQFEKYIFVEEAIFTESDDPDELPVRPQ